jgi:hypothetical protein
MRSRRGTKVPPSGGSPGDEIKDLREELGPLPWSHSGWDSERRKSDERLEHAKAVRGKRHAIADAPRPVWVGDQCPSYSHKIEVSVLHPSQERCEVVLRGATLAAHHLGHRVVERD